MSEAYLTNWLASQPCEDRNHFHEIALHEARVATDRRAAPARPRATGLLDRVRTALRGTTSVERCDCPVAA